MEVRTFILPEIDFFGGGGVGGIKEQRSKT